MTEEELKKIKEAYADIKTAMYHLNKAIDWDAEVFNEDDNLIEDIEKWTTEVIKSAENIKKVFLL